jgi:protein farnesyltransferase/geranylgeranyltransferase type-1 subunit alpha
VLEGFKCQKQLCICSEHAFGSSHGLQPSQEVRDAVEALEVSGTGQSDSDLGKTVCSILEQVDPIRANYWKWHKSKLPHAA